MTIAQCSTTRWLLAAAWLVAACTVDEPQKQVEAEYDQTTGKLKLLKYDSDKDGRIDAVSYMDGARVIRIEIDKDQDGRVERWEYYGASQKLEKVGLSRSNDGQEDAWSYPDQNGSIVRIEISTRRNGTISRTEHFEHDRPIRAEEDTDGDGVLDKWEVFEAGRLASVAFDSTHRGSPDRRLVYAADGSVRVEVDPDGDGQFTGAGP